MKLTDPAYLLTQQYRNSANLSARSSLHERFSTNPTPWQVWVFDQLHLAPGARVLEIGCGPGLLWSANLARLPAGCGITLSDFSQGMLADASRLASKDKAFRLACLDAQSIPFPGGAFDAVIANHMLYHVPDRPRALAEISRVLRTGGEFFAATNGAEHIHEIHAWVHRARWAAGLPIEGFPPLRIDGVGRNFSLENGTGQLSPFFSQVELLRREDGLRVTEVQPIIDYVRTMWSEILDEDSFKRLEALLTAELQRSGAISITKSSGMFHALK